MIYYKSILYSSVEKGRKVANRGGSCEHFYMKKGE